MSEKVLKALMQLFAIIARPDSNLEERRQVVGSFLKQQLNTELVNEYLEVLTTFTTNIKLPKKTLPKRKNALPEARLKY